MSAPVLELVVPDRLFRSLADRIPVLMWIAEPDGAAVFLNKAWLSLRGRTLQQELGHGWVEGIHEDDREACLTRYLTASSNREPFEFECRVLRADGVHRSVRLQGLPWVGADDVHLGYVCCADDISGARDVIELIDSRRRLQESEDQLRQLAARLQTAREEERADVARQLHDELGQTLTALKLDIGRMSAALRDDGISRRRSSTACSRSIGLSDIGIATVKRIATTLAAADARSPRSRRGGSLGSADVQGADRPAMSRAGQQGTDEAEPGAADGALQSASGSAHQHRPARACQRCAGHHHGAHAHFEMRDS